MLVSTFVHPYFVGVNVSCNNYGKVVREGQRCKVRNLAGAYSKAFSCYILGYIAAEHVYQLPYPSKGGVVSFVSIFKCI